MAAEQQFSSFLQEVQDGMYLDTTRQEIVKYHYDKLCQLVDGRLAHKNRFRKLLLGQKGVGKTRLLKAIIKAALSHPPFKDKLVAAHVSFVSFNLAETLSQTILRAINERPEVVKISELEKKLISANKFVFLVVDEMQTLFGAPFDPQKQHIIGELAEIGDSDHGRIHCVITGSSADLRRLCFGKLSQQQTHKYPNYHAINLNSTKFLPAFVFPMLAEKDFIELVKTIHPERNIDRSELAELFSKTGGIPGLVESIDEHDMWTISSKFDLNKSAIEEPEPAFLFSLCSVLGNSFCHSATTEDQMCFAVVSTMISVDIVHAEMKQLFPQVARDIAIYFDLADKGMIHYSLPSGPSVSVGLASPLIYANFIAAQQPTMQPREILALLNPRDPLDKLAETTMCKLFARFGASQELPVVGIKLNSDDFSEFDISEPNVLPPTLTLFKEVIRQNRDALGVDAAVIHGTTVHRFQVKLGTTGKIDRDSATALAQRIQQMQSVAMKHYTQLLKSDNVLCQNYLLTTRQIAPDVQDFLGNLQIKVINSKHLKRVLPANLHLLLTSNV